MARQARGKSMDPAKVQIFHTVQRCVRRAFLCGEDAVSRKSYDHRKQWIRERLELYLDLLDWTGRNLASGQAGCDPGSLGTNPQTNWYRFIGLV